MLLPKKYTATSALVFDVRAQDPVSGAAIPVANNFYTMGTGGGHHSPRVARKVLAQLRLADSPAAKQQWLDATDGQGQLRDSGFPKLYARS
jgi:hypothetical protein